MNPAGALRTLYRQDHFPVFQNRMYDSAAEAQACPTGDIWLIEDRSSGLVYNTAFCPELLHYDAHYQNEQALSPSFKMHLEAAMAIVERSLGRQALVEVGCGKGTFLEMLAARGIDITGFDPAYEGDNPRVERRSFAPGSGIAARGVVLRHVLEHIQAPHDFLRQLQAANGGGGRIYIEVPCFDWILEHRAWFDIFYEHVNYFRLSDFRRMFADVIECGRLFGGQYLYVVAELASLRTPQFDAADAVDFPEDFLRHCGNDASASAASPAAIWGGASKGVIFALLRARAGRPVATVIDINPAKQGKYLPATGLRVQSPAEALVALPQGATIYVMNSNYLDEIREMSHNAYHYVEVDRE